MKNANETLMTYILNLTEEQAAKLVDRLGLLKQVARMDEHQQVFLESFIDQVFGKVGV